MFEKVNPQHPDKRMDRICGFIVDLAYTIQENPKIAVEGLLGHGHCKIMIETSLSKQDMEEHLQDICDAVDRINGYPTKTEIISTSQDIHLARNQADGFRCGDNGIFRGVPLTAEQSSLAALAREIYEKYPTDGKYIRDKERIIICQSNADTEELKALYPDTEVNPLGNWSGGSDVDTGSANRKLGSDMADSVTGGGLHGKDLSKADVSMNIYAFLQAQTLGEKVEYSCAIGDTKIDGVSYAEIVERARQYIREIGGFEKFAEWGLV